MDRALVLVNRNQPVQLQSMLEGAFERQPVPVSEATADAYPENTVLLLDGDGEVVAESPLSAVADSLLFTNSDAYITGSVRLDEAELPAVLAGLEDVTFRLRGYPQSHKEKLLLIGVSRHIERIAWARDAGTIRTSFQRLSRIEDEVGTRRVYEQLASSDVNVHIYGVDDGGAPEKLDVSVHAGDTGDYRESWFVVYRPSELDGQEEMCAQDGLALLAMQDTSGVWDGYFTSATPEVLAIDDHIKREL